MKVKMPTGREVLNIFAEPEKVEAVASDTGAAVNVATAAVNNSAEGICPKCSRSMGIGIIPLGQVYYCTPCRVSTPVLES